MIIKKVFVILMLLPVLSYAQIRVSNEIKNEKNFFSIVGKTESASILYDTSENALIKRSADFLASDIEKVSSKKVNVISSTHSLKNNIIIIATLGNNPLVEKLITSKKLKVDVLKGQWERFMIQTVENPFPGVGQALIILGSDRRGAAYGVFTLSEKMGISPWYWWADVPVKKNAEIYIEKGRYVSESPSVKYRGIFINDEAPALRGWAKEKFGGFNHTFYEKVFELLLRNKANYLWPAMWLPSAFFDDDPQNPQLADEYGIVISTSHHEPMMRAHHEWIRFNGGAWNYETNKAKLQEFWRGGIERMGGHESVVTVGMRGDGDEAMAEGTAIELMQTIIRDQRKIIADVTGKPAAKTQQVWAIYKEVQDYYDKGMRVDDDIMILFCDDNWGNVRILPKKENRDYKGGYGLYYHFDYVGAPVSYRWLNVTQIERVWEQMNLAYQWGIKDLWIVNVGDIKPMELPISFFLDYAWNTRAIKADELPKYYIHWANQQFGSQYAQEIANILSLYTKYNARRTPEMLKPDTYSLLNYREADRIVEEFKQLRNRSKIIFDQLQPNYKSAFYQLVLSPIEMCANLNEMYVAAAKNKLYSEQGRTSANYYAEKVQEHFQKDAKLTEEFHNLENGKWNQMMSQTHIGYPNWNNPPANKMPPVSYIQPRKNASLGYMVEYGERDGLSSKSFPSFDPLNNQNYYVDIFNMGNKVLSYTITTPDNWINVSASEDTITYDKKVYISIDWNKAPKGETTGQIIISGAGSQHEVKVPIRNNLPASTGFVENNGAVSIEASHFTNKFESPNINWTVVPNLGRTSSAVIEEPANADRQPLNKTTPRLEYAFTIFDSADLKVETYLSPTQNYKKNEGLKYAIAIDDEEPQIVNMNEGETKPDWEYAPWWMNSVADHIKTKISSHPRIKPGKHTLKIWMIDPGVVFQKFVIDAGGLKPSYLGPPESVYIHSK